AEARQLRVLVGEEPALQKGVVGEVDARHHIGGAKGDLLGLREKIVGIAVQHHASDRTQRNHLLGYQLGGIEHVESQTVGLLLRKQLKRQFPLGEIPAVDRFPQIAAVEIGVCPLIFNASSQTTDCMPSLGRQWNLTNIERSFPSTSRKVWTPKPSIIRKLRGIARSDITHMIMCMLSGVREMKSQNVSCAVCACGNSRSGSCLAAWIRSGNLMASWMKNTGMLLPTRSKLPS